MQVHTLGGPGALGVSVVRHLPGLIDALGSPAFVPSLFSAMRGIVGCEHVTAFAWPEGGAPRLLYAADAGGVGAARAAASRYLSGYWPDDPANRMASATLGDNGLALRLLATDLPTGGYRRECYTTLGLVDRFSVLRCAGLGQVRMNFYRARTAGRFSDDDMDRIIEAAPVLLALLMQNEPPPAALPTAAAAMDARLRQACPVMSMRERQVCVGIGRGLTSEAISLDLGIALNSVLTYRKRAYAKLGISSQNELMRLAFSH